MKRSTWIAHTIKCVFEAEQERELDEFTPSTEQILGKGICGRLETDSDLYVAHRYIVKRYGENGALYV